MQVSEVNKAQFYTAVKKAASVRREQKDAGTAAVMGKGAPGFYQQLMTGGEPWELISNAYNNRIEQGTVDHVEGLLEINKVGLRQTEEAVINSFLYPYGAVERIPRNLNARTEELRKIHRARGKHSIEQFEKETRDNPHVREWMARLGLNINDLIVPVHNPFEADITGGRLKAEILHRAADGGLFHTPFPESYEGFGFNQQMTDLVIGFLPSLGGGLAATIKVWQSLGKRPLDSATEEQRQFFIPQLLPKDKKERGLVAFLLTEEAAGTDAFGGMESRAELTEDGERLRIFAPSKKFITCFHVAKHGHMAVNIIDPDTRAKLPTVLELQLPFRFDDKKEDMKKHLDALWDKRFEITDAPMRLNAIGASSQLYGEMHGYEIPLRYAPDVLSIMGGWDGIGKGDEQIGGGLYKGRLGFIALSAANSALAFNLALDESVNEDRIRFKGTLSKNESVKSQIGDMAIQVEMLKAYAECTSAMIDNNSELNFVPEAAIGKAFATEIAHGVIATANFLFGGEGLMKGRLIEQVVRDHGALRVVEGANPPMFQLGAGSSLGPALAAKTIGEKAKIAVSQFMIPSQGNLSFWDALKLTFRSRKLSLSTLGKGAWYQMKMREKQNDLIDISYEEATIFAIVSSKLKLQILKANPEKHKKEIAALEGFLKIVNGEKPNLVGIGQLYIDNAQAKYQTRKRENEELVRKYS